MVHCLVTGGAGFIGSHLAAALVERGDRVRVLDNLSTGKRANLESIGGPVEFIDGDLIDPDTIGRAVQGIDLVFHHAALASVPGSIEKPLETDTANVRGTIHLLEAARRAGVRRVIYAGSCSAYGPGAKGPCTEENLPDPISPYAVQKLAAEHYCRAHWHCHGLETVVLRYFNVFGERQDPTSHYAAVIPKFIERALRDLPPVIHGDGTQTRDFSHVENNVRANLIAAEHPEAVGRTFNIATGVSISLLDLVREIGEILGKEIEPEFAPLRPGDVKHSAADIGRARQVLGFEPTVDLREGLRRTIDFFRRAAI
jgi:UDP-glucose 4-epimerase